MRITAKDVDNRTYRIFLNDKEVLTALAADDTEGWVDILDLSVIPGVRDSATDIDFSNPNGELDVPIKRLHGSVIVKKR